LQRAEETARAASDAYSLDVARRARLLLAVVSRGAIAVPENSWARDTSTASFLTRGLRAAIAGDQTQARRLLSAARARPRRELAYNGATPALLEAWIAALEGRWEETARVLQPLARQPIEIGEVYCPAGLSLVRWLLADAFEKLGHPDSAAVYLEKVTADPGSALQESHLRGAACSFTHHRLVLLYARMGRIEDAKRHWKIFTETVDRPDPELRPLIAEARAALVSAEGMTKSAVR